MTAYIEQACKVQPGDRVSFSMDRYWRSVRSVDLATPDGHDRRHETGTVTITDSTGYAKTLKWCDGVLLDWRGR